MDISGQMQADQKVGKQKAEHADRRTDRGPSEGFHRPCKGEYNGTVCKDHKKIGHGDRQDAGAAAVQAQIQHQEQRKKPDPAGGSRAEIHTDPAVCDQLHAVAEAVHQVCRHEERDANQKAVLKSGVHPFQVPQKQVAAAGEQHGGKAAKSSGAKKRKK